MDYRNADGSIAEMCGNGVRVFTLFLHEEGLVDRSEFAIGTRAGQRTVTLLPDGRIRVGMGVPTVDSEPTPGAAGGSGPGPRSASTSATRMRSATWPRSPS